MTLAVKYFLLALLLIPSKCLSEGELSGLLFWKSNALSTEKRMLHLIYKSERASRKTQWNKAIRLGKKALIVCQKLYPKHNPTCISIMKSVSFAYYKNGELTKENERHIKETFQLASIHLGSHHPHTITAREVHYHLLMALERYEELIPLTQEFIRIEKSSENDEYKILEWEIFLYALYVVNEQKTLLEPTLLRMKALTENLIGTDSEEFKRVVSSLAKSYCANKKYADFFELIKKYRLNIRCKLEQRQRTDLMNPKLDD